MSHPPCPASPAGAATPLFASVSPGITGYTYYHNVLGITASSKASYDSGWAAQQYDDCLAAMQQHMGQVAGYGAGGLGAGDGTAAAGAGDVAGNPGAVLGKDVAVWVVEVQKGSSSTEGFQPWAAAKA